MSLPISKLRGVPLRTRALLKGLRITTCAQLLAAAGVADDRARLAARTGIEAELLLAMVRRADMVRVKGVGSVFGLMLEDLGVHDVATLAAQGAPELHEALRSYNRDERLARRSPTPEEVLDWVTQARALPPLIA